MEFMTALLQVWAGREKETLYVREARHMKIRILPPDVNISGVVWTLDRKVKAIRRGMLSIKGIGVAFPVSAGSKDSKLREVICLVFIYKIPYLFIKLFPTVIKSALANAC